MEAPAGRKIDMARLPKVGVVSPDAKNISQDPGLDNPNPQIGSVHIVNQG